MKKHYEKRTRYRDPSQWAYDLRWGSSMFRAIRTFPELRRNEADRCDFRDVSMKGVRARRNSNLLDPWNDFPVSRSYGKSWKDYTRHRKQWMVCDDPKPRRRRWPYENILLLPDCWH